jgi:hypothetical protein
MDGQGSDPSIAQSTERLRVRVVEYFECAITKDELKGISALGTKGQRLQCRIKNLVPGPFEYVPTVHFV